VHSVPTELSQDHAEIINSAAAHGFVSAQALSSELKWPTERAQRGLVSRSLSQFACAAASVDITCKSRERE
jgi:hypothetical protein